jgi:hypothetical protein
MALDDETKKVIKELVAPIVGSALSAALVGAATAIILKMIVTNYHETNLKGETDMHPTDDNVTMSKTEASGKDNDASLAKDEMKGKDGDLALMQTDAAGSTTEAKAMNAGATAAKPVAGALDVKTKGLVMS